MARCHALVFRKLYAALANSLVAINLSFASVCSYGYLDAISSRILVGRILPTLRPSRTQTRRPRKSNCLPACPSGGYASCGLDSNRLSLIRRLVLTASNDSEDRRKRGEHMTKLRILSGAGALIGVLSIFNAWAQGGQTGSAPMARSIGGDSARMQAESDQRKKSTPAAVVAASEPVVTIHGLCQDQSIQADTAANSCTTIVTREAFEKLLDSMNVTGKTLTPETRRNLAETYAQYLALERPATKAGLETTQRFADIMRWWRLRTLADLYRGSLQEQFKSPSRDEVHAYYVEHLSSYQRIKASRILIPRTMGDTNEAQRSDKKALEIANIARERAAKGKDPELLQKDAYSALGIASPPITDLGAHPRSSFPTEETDELFSLEPGQVSKVEAEGASYVIYKIASKETLSEDSVIDEISRQIAQNKYDETIRSARESAKPEFNQTYFGPPGPASPAVHSSPLGSPHP